MKQQYGHGKKQCMLKFSTTKQPESLHFMLTLMADIKAVVTSAIKLTCFGSLLKTDIHYV